MKQDTQTNQTKPTNKSNETQTNKIKYQCNLDINTFYTIQQFECSISFKKKKNFQTTKQNNIHAFTEMT